MTGIPFLRRYLTSPGTEMRAKWGAPTARFTFHFPHGLRCGMRRVIGIPNPEDFATGPILGEKLYTSAERSGKSNGSSLCSSRPIIDLSCSSASIPAIGCGILNSILAVFPLACHASV